MYAKKVQFSIETFLFYVAYVGIELAVVSSDSTLQEGQTTLLACLGFNYEQPVLTVSWTRNGAPVMNSSLVSTYQEDTVDGRRVFQGSFVEICSVGIDDADNYTCTVTNGMDSLTSTVEITVLRKNFNVIVIIDLYSLFLTLNYSIYSWCRISGYFQRHYDGRIRHSSTRMCGLRSTLRGSQLDARWSSCNEFFCCVYLRRGYCSSGVNVQAVLSTVVQCGYG